MSTAVPPWPEPLSREEEVRIAEGWTLDPAVTFLNHGSFGACPRTILDYQSELRARMEREPVRFFGAEVWGLLDEARQTLGEFLGADPEGVAFVPNATTGVNSVLRSLNFEPGDELLTTSHDYNACRNVLNFVAQRTGARVVVADVPFPLDRPEQVTEAVLGAATQRTRLALIDHVTSPTGLVFPVGEIVAALRERGIETLIDGAHAPGMVDLDLEKLGAAWFTGNCHKWMCAPKGAAVLWAREDVREATRPAVLSHGDTLPVPERSRFRLEFDWTGTDDPTPHLAAARCVTAIPEFLNAGTWTAVRERNRATAIAGRALLAERLGLALPAPDSMLGSLGALPLPPATTTDVNDTSEGFVWSDPRQRALLERYRIQVPIFTWPSTPGRVLRISAQLYNRQEHYERLSDALVEIGSGA